MLNVLAYRHAKAMLTYTQQGERTASPESLSFLQKAKTLLTGVKIPKPRNPVTPATLNLSFEVHQLRLSENISLEGFHLFRGHTFSCFGAGYKAVFQGFVTIRWNMQRWSDARC